jgi:hypothetical protein
MGLFFAFFVWIWFLCPNIRISCHSTYFIIPITCKVQFWYDSHKTNSDYWANSNNDTLQQRRYVSSPHFNSSVPEHNEICNCLSQRALYLLKRKECVWWYDIFVFQRATEGPESVAHKNLIVPFKNDMPKSDLDGLKAACSRHKYAYIGTNFLRLQLSSALTCQLVPLPETSYPETLTYIISQKNPYKRLINWRWVGQGKLRTHLSIDYALLKGQRKDKSFWVIWARVNLHQSLKEAVSFNSRAFWPMSTNIGTHDTSWAAI